MSTRRLIITALVCGMAILVAGGAFLVRVARNRADLTASVLTVGDSATVGRLVVRVDRFTRRADTVVVGVTIDGSKLTSADVPTLPTDAAAPWSMVIRTPRTPVDPTADDGPACKGLTIDPGRTVTCAVAFQGGDGAPFLAFSSNGAQVQWRLLS